MSSLALCIIFKNEEFFIKDCLLSCLNSVDEVVLVDSGSTDQTQSVVTQLQQTHPKIKLLNRQWPGDFANQRNYAISEVKSDWILFLDADERIDASSHTLIRDAISKAENYGYLLPIRNYTNNFSEIGYTPISNAPATGFVLTHLHRLFKRDPRIQYEGILHERIEPSLERHKLKTTSLNAIIHHLGPLKEQNLGLKKERMKFYEELGRAKIKQNPQDAQAHWELGVVLQKQKRLPEASEEFKRAQDLQPAVEEFEVYWLLSLFQQERWKDLSLITPRFHKASFFKMIALAQTDASAIEKTDEFRAQFAQAPLLIFELSLIHHRRDRIDQDRKAATLNFGKTGLVEFIEGSFLIRQEKWQEALTLLKISHEKGCRLGLKDYLTCLGKLNDWKEARKIISSLSPTERTESSEITNRLIEIIEQMPA